MTDTQILTLVITLLGIFAASWFNNSRIGDVSLRISDRINDMRDVLRAEMKVERAEVDTRFDRLEAKIDRMDDNVAKILADHEHRISKLEGDKQ